MKYLTRILAAALTGLAALPACAAVSWHLSVNFDRTFTTDYPNGDKPESVCTTPAGWTSAVKGDGFGEICQVSATEFSFAVGGTSASNKFEYVYQDVPSGDFQLIARVKDDYSPATLGNFAGLGITISDGTADADVICNIFSPLSSSATARSLCGTPGSTTNTDGATGQSRPHWLCAGYDESETEVRVLESVDGVTWLSVSTFDRAFSTPIVGLYGQSGSSTETLSASFDNIALTTGPSAITCWTPPTPPDPTAPTLTTPIPNQSGTQGSSFTLNVAANFLGETSFSIPANGAANGLPTGTGISFNTSTGTFTGTFTANDVGTRNIRVSATNAVGTITDDFTLVVQPNTGDTFNIPAGTATFNCQSQGVGPGDTIVLAAGNRGDLGISNCNGDDKNRITIRNDSSSGTRTTFRRAGGKSFTLTITDSSNWNLDGRNWSGAPAGQVCGVDPADLSEDGTAACGIRFEVASGGLPVAFLKINGTSTNFGVYGVAIDGTGATGGGIGISCNDKTVANGYSGTGTYNGRWREDITLSQNAIVHLGLTDGEGVYCGQNAVDDGLPLRRVTFSYNYVEDTARECLNGKYWREGPNYVHHNVVRDCSSANSGGQRRGINITDGGDVDIYDNQCYNVQGPCVSHIINSAEAADPGDTTHYSNIYNNVAVDGSTAVMDNGVFIEDANAAQDQISPVNIYNNTIVNASGVPITHSDNSGTCTARDNIIAGANTNVQNCTDTSNTKGTAASMNFANLATANVHLTASSPACNASSNDATPTEDYEGTSRPQDSHSDDGADENALCPTN